MCYKSKMQNRSVLGYFQQSNDVRKFTCNVFPLVSGISMTEYTRQRIMTNAYIQNTYFSDMRSTSGWQVLLLMNENNADVMLAVKPARLFKSSEKSSLSMVVGTGIIPMNININSNMATIGNHSRSFGSKFCSSSIKCSPRRISAAITQPHDTVMRILLPYRSIRYTLIQPTTIPEMRNIASSETIREFSEQKRRYNIKRRDSKRIYSFFVILRCELYLSVSYAYSVF